MLPQRIPKKPKRATRWRSQAHCNFVRLHGCSVQGCGGRPIEVAHVRIGSGAGIGQKPDPEALIVEFIKASPKRHEIEQIRRERENG